MTKRDFEMISAWLKRSMVVLLWVYCLGTSFALAFAGPLPLWLRLIQLVAVFGLAGWDVALRRRKKANTDD